MNFRNFLFSVFITLMLTASGVFAQTTHMGVPAKDMVVLTASCTSSQSFPTCESNGINGSSSGETYRRVLADGTTESFFSIPDRKVLVITDYEWKYSEETVLEDSINDPLTVTISLPFTISVSQSSLRVTPGDSILSTQGHAAGATQMTSGFVVSVLPKWHVNRVILDQPISMRTFLIVLRGYLLDVP